MRSIWMIVVAVAACDSGTPTCKDAVTKARSADEAMSFDSAARLVGKCELKEWSVATRQCIANAKSRHDLDTCTGDRSSTTQAMAAMTKFKDEMCQCTTSECAQRISDEMTKWGQEQSKDMTEPPKLSDEETKAFTALGEQMGKCMQKAMSVPLDALQPSEPPPPPPTRAAPKPATAAPARATSNDIPF
jgi:hypothetical protein